MEAPPFHMLMRVKGRCSLSVLDSYDEIIGTRIAAKLEEVGENVESLQNLLQAEYKLRDQITEEAVTAFAAESQSKIAFDNASTDVEKYHGLARRAVRAGADDDARMFIRKMLDVKDSLASREEAYLEAKEIADQLRELGTKVHRDIKALQQKKAEVLRANGYEPQISDITGQTTAGSEQVDPVEEELHRLKVETFVYQK